MIKSIDDLATDLPTIYTQLLECASAVWKNDPIRAKLCVLQAILESGLSSGKPSGLAKYNNLFGIKGSGTKGSIGLMTTEHLNGEDVRVRAPFATNNTLQDSFQQYQDFLRKYKRYKPTLEAETLDETITAIGKSGYATDPKYSSKLSKILNLVTKANQ